MPVPPVLPEGPETACEPEPALELAEPVLPELSEVDPAALAPPTAAPPPNVDVPVPAVGAAVTPELPPSPPPALAVLRLVPPRAVPLTGPPPMARAKFVALPAVPP